MTSIQLDSFVLEDVLASGATGAIWRGHHQTDGTPVAVKVLNDERVHSRYGQLTIANEVQSVARLNHPGIVRIFDYGELPGAIQARSLGRLKAGSPYIIMELLERGSLQRPGLVRTWPQLETCLVSLLDALAHAHARGVVHRDIKPANVLIRHADAASLEAVLTDFGIAQAVSSDHADAMRERVSGTPNYMAPEQILGLWRDQGPWTDLYSVGCLTYYLATGHPPFSGLETADVLARQLKSPAPELDADFAVPEGFQQWLMKLLEKDADHRYQRAADAAYDLFELGAPTQSAPQAREQVADAESPEAAATQVIPDATQRLTTTLNASDWNVVLQADRRRARHRDHQRLARAAGADSNRCPPLPDTWLPPQKRPGDALLSGAGLGLFGLRAVPFVDRERERDALWTELHDVHASGGVRTVMLRGPAGHGKSRIVEWVAQRAHEVGGATVLRANHTPVPGPADGVAAMLRRHLRVEGLGRGDTMQRLKKRLQKLGVAEQRASYELLAATELLRSPDQREESIAYSGIHFSSPKERWAALKKLLEWESTRRPLIIWLDDVQWSVDALGFAKFLAEVSSDLDALLVLTCCDDALEVRRAESRLADELESLDQTRSLDVDALPKAEHRELVERLLPLEPTLAERVVDHTRGSPLFAVQLLGDWVERDLLVPGPDGFELADDVQLPETFDRLWSRRLRITLESSGVPAARVDDQIRALELASVMGQHVDDTEWMRACHIGNIDVHEQLLPALTRQNIVKTTRIGWAFSHETLRRSLVDAAKASGRWPRDHEICAEMLQQLHGDELAAQRRIGLHLLETDAPGDAFGPLLTVSKRLVKTGDLVPAHELLRSLHDLCEDQNLEPDDQGRLRVELLRAHAAIKTGDLEEADELLEMLGEKIPEHRTELIADRNYICGFLDYRRANISDALGSIEAARDAYDELGDPFGVARARRALGDLYRSMGEYDAAAEEFRSCLPFWRRIGDRVQEAGTHLGLSHVERSRGRLDLSEEYLQHALETARESGYLFGAAWATNGIAGLAKERGDLEKAEKYYRETVQRLVELGSEDRYLIELNVALVQIQRGDFTGARERLVETWRVMHKSKRSGYLGFLHVELLVCAAAQTQWSDFDLHAKKIGDTLGEAGLVDEDLADLLIQAADYAVEVGERERALHALDHAQQQAEKLDDNERLQTIARMRSALSAPATDG